MVRQGLVVLVGVVVAAQPQPPLLPPLRLDDFGWLNNGTTRHTDVFTRVAHCCADVEAEDGFKATGGQWFRSVGREDLRYVTNDCRATFP